MSYVIVSECEHGFWSNQFGWVQDKASASIFSNANEFPVPLRARHEGYFLDIELAPEFYLDEPLSSGDKVVLDSVGDLMRVDKVKTADGCARTSDDIVVLRDFAGVTLETFARSIAYASPALKVLEA